MASHPPEVASRQTVNASLWDESCCHGGTTRSRPAMGACDAKTVATTSGAATNQIDYTPVPSELLPSLGPQHPQTVVSTLTEVTIHLSGGRCCCFSLLAAHGACNGARKHFMPVVRPCIRHVEHSIASFVCVTWNRGAA